MKQKAALLCAGLVCMLQVQFLQGAEDTPKPYRATPLQIGIWDDYQLAPVDWDVWGLRLGAPWTANRMANGVDLGVYNQAQGSLFVLEAGAYNRVCSGNAVQVGIFNKLSHRNHSAKDLIGRGVQLGFDNEMEGYGLQIGLANLNGKTNSAAGVQLGVLGSMADGEWWDGIQVGALCHSGKTRGIQIAGLSNSAEDVSGIQASSPLLFGGNYSDHLRGLQVGLALIPGVQKPGPIGNRLGDRDEKKDSDFIGGCNNFADKMDGIQIGLFYNKANQARGLQVALVNRAKTMTGVQIGLLNIIENSSCSTLPLINARF